MGDGNQIGGSITTTPLIGNVHIAFATILRQITNFNTISSNKPISIFSEVIVRVCLPWRNEFLEKLE